MLPVEVIDVSFFCINDILLKRQPWLAATIRLSRLKLIIQKVQSSKHKMFDSGSGVTRVMKWRESSQAPGSRVRGSKI